MANKLSVFGLILLISLSGCKLLGQNAKEQKVKNQASISKVNSNTPPPNALGPPTVVYKTKKNYNDLVPIILSDDKSRISSYPDPMDVTSLPKPILLKNGYLLDRRGINKNVAFIKLTYEEYARLPKAPSVATLKSWIVDKNPLVEIYDCGLHAKFEEEQVAALNALIESGNLGKKCRLIQ